MNIIMFILLTFLFSSILTHDGSVYGLERDRVFLYDDSTHVLSFDQLRKVSVHCNPMCDCGHAANRCCSFCKFYTIYSYI